MAVQGQYH